MWYSTEKKLPAEGKYVIAKHNRDTWCDDDNQENVNTVIVKLIKGLSIEDRKKLKNTKRYLHYCAADEYGNNKKPYYWQQFGPDSFFGQNITHWMEIPKWKGEKEK